MVTSGSRLTRRRNKRTHLVKIKVSSSTNKYHFFFKFKTMMTFIFYLFSGVLERAPCGLKLGWGEGYENFNGCIDEVRYSCIVYCYWNSCNRNIHASLTVFNFISDCFFYALLGHKCVTVVFLVIVAESTSKRPLWLIA